MLNQEQISFFNNAGYLIFPDLFSLESIRSMIKRADELGNIDGPERIIETSGEPCSVYIHFDDPIFSKIMRSEALALPAENLLNGKVYVHQCKVNHKVALTGSEVSWHRDFIYWHLFDAMPTDNALTVAIALDDVNDFNSPLLFIEGSHKIEDLLQESSSIEPLHSESSAELSWINTEKVSQSIKVGQLRYTFTKEELSKLTQDSAIVPFKGKAGSAAFFHSNLVHGSNKNISPWDRRMLFITYNSVNNVLKPVKTPRANFIANQNFAAI